VARRLATDQPRRPVRLTPFLRDRLLGPSNTARLAAGFTLGVVEGDAVVIIWDTTVSGTRSPVKQLVEEHPVRNESLPKVFCRCLSGLAHFENLMRAAIVLNHLGVVDRNEVGLSIKVSHRIALVNHHVGDQRIGSAKRKRRGIDELNLHLAPIRLVTVALPRVKRPNREPVALVGASLQVGLGLPGAARCLDCPVVFRTEAISELAAPPRSPRHHHAATDNQ